MQIKEGGFSHAHLFACQDSFSVKAFCLLIAQTLLCDKEEACGECGGCRKVLARTHADLYILPKENNFVVADSQFVIENAFTKPINSNKKVFILNDFDNANQASQNKMLKILEEPNRNVYFLINAVNSKKLLPTVISRVQKHFFPPHELEGLKKILEEKGVQYTQSALSLSDGYLGRVLWLSEDKEFAKSYEFVKNMLKNMKSSKDVINFSGEMAQRSPFVLKLEILERFFRNMLLINLQSQHLLHETEFLTVQGFAKEFSPLAIVSILNKLTNAKMLCDSNVGLSTVADNLLLGILEDKFLWK